MKKVFVSVSKENKVVATGYINVNEVGDEAQSKEVLADQLRNNTDLYALVTSEGTNIYKGVIAIVALSIRGYRVVFKEFKEKVK